MPSALFDVGKFDSTKYDLIYGNTLYEYFSCQIPNCVGFWDFEQYSSFDFSLSNNGLQSDSFITSPTVYKMGSVSRYYNGTNFDTTSNAITLGTNNFTLAIWVYSPSPSTYGFLNYGSSWGLQYTSGSLSYYDAGLGYILSNAMSLSDGWHRVVITREGTGTNQVKLYVDGVLKQTGTAGTNYASSTFNFGAGYLGNNIFAGYLDQIILCNGSAWDQNQVNNDYNSGNGNNYNGYNDSTYALASNALSQTFTIGTVGPNEGMKLKSANIYFLTGTGNATLSVKATDANGKPTGSDLDSTTFSVGAGWNSVNFTGGYVLSQGTKYALCLTPVNTVYLTGRNTQLQAYYTFDEGSGTTAYDSFNTHNATLTSSNPSYGTGKINTGLVFSGVSSSYGSIPSWTYTNTDFSFGGWVKINATTGSNQTIICQQTPATYNGFSLDYVNSTGKFQARIGKGSSPWVYATSSTVATIGNWYHVLGVFDSVNHLIKIYVNGNLEDSQSQTGYISIPSDNLYIGCSQGTGSWCNATIDEIGLWAKTLTSNEAVNLYNGGKGLAYPLHDLIKGADYTGGSVYRLSSGTWNILSFEDLNFEVYGQISPIPISLSEIPSMNDTTIKSISTIKSDNPQLTGLIYKSTSRTISDTINLIASIIKSVNKSDLEVLNLTDARTYQANYNRNYSEVLNLTDTIKRMILGAALSESLLASPNVYKNYSKTAMTDNLQLTGTPSNQPNKVLTGIINLTETRIDAIYKAFAELVLNQDSIYKSISHMALTELINLISSLNSVLAKMPFVEIINTNDNLSKGPIKYPSEIINLTDAIKKATSKIYSESSLLTDNLSKLANKYANEITNLSGSLSFSTNKSLTEVANLSSALLKSENRELLENTLLTPLLTRLVNKFALSEELDLTSDQKNSVIKLLLETVLSNDSLKKDIAFFLTDVLLLSPLFNYTYQSIHRFDANEILYLSETSRKIDLTRIILEELDLIDYLIPNHTYYKTLLESLLSSALCTNLIAKINTANLNLTDSISKRDVLKSIVDLFLLIDLFERFYTGKRQVAEIIALSETKVFNINRLLNETAGLFDYYYKFQNRNLKETLELYDLFGRFISTTLTESFELLDLILISKDRLRFLIEANVIYPTILRSENDEGDILDLANINPNQINAEVINPTPLSSAITKPTWLEAREFGR